MAADDDDGVWCAVCGAPQSLVGAFEHLAVCRAAEQARRVAALAPSPLTTVFVDVEPAAVWGAVKGGDVGVDARDATEIVPGLWLGNVVAAKSAAWLAATGVSAIVNCAREVTPLSTSELAGAGLSHLRVVVSPLGDDDEVATVRRSLSLIVQGAHVAA